MKKQMIVLICALVVVLCGCSSKTEEKCPVYFELVLKEIETNNENTSPVIEKWMNQSTDFSEEYAEKIYSCVINGVEYSFDLHDVLSNAEEWYWSTAGIFFDGEDKTYICLHDYNIMYESGIEQEYQLLLIEFSTNAPDEYQIYPYKVEPSYLFGWDVICYRLENDIYIAGETELVAIELDTKQMRYCRKEMEALSDLVKKNYGEEAYHPFFFRAILEQDDVVVYSAQLAEAIDTAPAYAIYIAYENEEIISYMTVDLCAEEIKDSVTIEKLK